MTPQTSPTLHPPDTREGVGHGAGAVAAAAPLALPTRRLKLVSRADARTARMRRESLERRMLGAADMLAAGLSIVLVGELTGHPGLAALAGAPLVVLLFKVAGLYDRGHMRLAHSTLDETPTLLQLTGLYVLALAILSPAVDAGSLRASQIAGLWVVGFGATVLGRMVARWLAGKTSPVERCVVIGDAKLAGRIREKLASSHARAEVIAALPLAAGQPSGWESLERLRRVIAAHDPDRVIIAPTSTDAGGVAELIRAAKAADVRVSVLPRMLEVVGSAVEFDDVDGLTMMGVRPFGLSRSSWLLKRAFDIVATSIGLIAVAPILAAIAAAIRLDTEGPILFRQVRVGRDGRPFHILKFRSMVVGADAQKDQLRDRNEVGDGMFKIASDPRVTRIGGFLRRTSLDELPQLFNVLRGEMSLVGPRPLVTEEDERVLGLDRSRLHLTPGMTGPWQVLGARVPMQEMVGIDYLYVANWSLWADLKLLLRTFRHVARRGNV